MWMSIGWRISTRSARRINKYDVYSTRISGYSQIGSSKSDDTSHVRPFTEIPKHSILRMAWYMATAEPYTLHRMYDDVMKKLSSPICRTPFGNINFVSIYDPAATQVIMKHEGIYPTRFPIEPWNQSIDDAGAKRGVLTGTDHAWQRSRTVVNKHMMRPHNVALHTGVFNTVVNDFMSILDDDIRRGHGRVKNIREKLFNWSLESGCSMIYEDRLGCLDPSPHPDIKRFVDALQGMLSSTDALLIFPIPVAKFIGLPAWKKHSQFWGTLIEIGRRYGLKRIEAARKQLEAGEEAHGLVASMVQHGDLSDDEILGNLTDLMAGAVDSTSTTTLWTLYMLTKHPDVQEKLSHEIKELVPPGENATQTHLKKMSFLKAVVKETLRLYPVAPFHNRKLADDAVIHGYNVPKGTFVQTLLWTMGRSANVFRDPEKFRPERWLRENADKERIHPYANMSFGVGPRSCIGRRVAELEVYLLLTKILQQYEVVDGSPSVEIEALTRVLLAPKTDPDLVFKKRK